MERFSSVQDDSNQSTGLEGTRKMVQDHPRSQGRMFQSGIAVKRPSNWYIFKKSINLKEQRPFFSKIPNDLFLQKSRRIFIITPT